MVGVTKGMSKKGVHNEGREQERGDHCGDERGGLIPIAAMEVHSEYCALILEVKKATKDEVVREFEKEKAE
ncbi:hypothetical protein U1Q18_045368 [Sarracenia purpurea var. burkii]